jgi:hypothetical protein
MPPPAPPPPMLDLDLLPAPPPPPPPFGHRLPPLPADRPALKEVQRKQPAASAPSLDLSALQTRRLKTRKREPKYVLRGLDCKLEDIEPEGFPSEFYDTEPECEAIARPLREEQYIMDILWKATTGTELELSKLSKDLERAQKAKDQKKVESLQVKIDATLNSLARDQNFIAESIERVKAEGHSLKNFATKIRELAQREDRPVNMTIYRNALAHVMGETTEESDGEDQPVPQGRIPTDLIQRLDNLGNKQNLRLSEIEKSLGLRLTDLEKALLLVLSRSDSQEARLAEFERALGLRLTDLEDAISSMLSQQGAQMVETEKAVREQLQSLREAITALPSHVGQLGRKVHIDRAGETERRVKRVTPPPQPSGGAWLALSHLNRSGLIPSRVKPSSKNKKKRSTKRGKSLGRARGAASATRKRTRGRVTTRRSKASSKGRRNTRYRK